MNKKRMVVGISGASGAMLGVMLLKEMQKHQDWETHLVISKGGRITICHETGMTPEEVEALATVSYPNDAIGATVASGTFSHHGMVIVPCSMKTLAGVAHGFSDNLLLRAADVTLKERRRLVLVAREAPLSLIHLENMLTVSRAGAIILPPVLELYSHPKSIEDMMFRIVGKIMRRFEITTEGFLEWDGIR